MDARHLGVTSEEVRHGRGIAGRSPHPKRKRLQRTRQHPARMRVELRATLKRPGIPRDGMPPPERKKQGQSKAGEAHADDRVD